MGLRDRGSYLLPHWCRVAGYALLLPGIVLAFVRYYYRWSPDWLNIKVFAASSFYLERKVASVVQNNVTEEIAGVLVVLGLVAVGASAEKLETERLARIRLRAFMLALYGYACVLVFTIAFTFGLSFLEALVPTLLAFPVLYLLAFAILKRRGGGPGEGADPR